MEIGKGNKLRRKNHEYVKFSKGARNLSILFYLVGFGIMWIEGSSTFEILIVALLFGIYGLLAGS